MYCAYITTIKEIHKHSNADRLQCCEIFGNNVIVDMSYAAGGIELFIFLWMVSSAKNSQMTIT